MANFVIVNIFIIFDTMKSRFVNAGFKTIVKQIWFVKSSIFVCVSHRGSVYTLSAKKKNFFQTL